MADDKILDFDLVGMSRAELFDVALNLRRAIRLHRDEKGHNRCWLDDQRLYDLLPDNIPADTKLPPRDEFLKNCEKYWQDRQKPDGPLISNTRCCP